MLKTFLDGYQWRMFGSLNPLNFLEGPYTRPNFLIEVTPFNTWGDFINYLSRLDNMPNQLNQMIDRHRKAIQMGHTSHRASVKAIPDQIDLLIVANPLQSIFYKPFNDTLDGLDSIPQSEKEALRQRAKSSVGSLISAYDGMKMFIIDEFMPHTRASFGVENWEINGTKNYAACLKYHTSLDLTAEEVHKKGLSEVERISKEMKKIMDKLGKSGTIKQFFDELKEDPTFHRESAAELLKMYEELVSRAIETFPPMFSNYPNLPVRVLPRVNDGPASYQRGSEDGSRPGTFFANVLRPEETSTFTMPALTLHETVPGHHLQRSYGLKADLPTFRKNAFSDGFYAVPFTFPSYTACDEGWALYAESLGEELGFYRDDYELMGRYDSEIFRACRLVVDTGIHHYGWSSDRAVEYMLNYTALSRNYIELEVDRYITWPGQACSYKIGELKIKELRQKATEKLGTLFDIKEFHSTILNTGPLPLSVMEDLVNTWIDTTMAKANQEGGTGSASNLSILLAEILIFVTSGKFISTVI